MNVRIIGSMVPVNLSSGKLTIKLKYWEKKEKKKEKDHSNMNPRI